MNVTASLLDSEKAEEFETVLRSVLASKLAEDTFAMLIDGLPTSLVSARMGGDWTRMDIREREQPSINAIEKAKRLRETSSLSTLPLNVEAAQAYQSIDIRTNESNVRLLGLVALVVHDLAISLFTGLHPNGEKYDRSKISYGDYPLPRRSLREYVDGTPRPDFFHINYDQLSNYPRGRFEPVGFWAEAQILGGVVLFDHSNADLRIQAVFIHPPFVLLFQPSQEQISKFASLGSKNGAAYDEILPFKPEPGALSICDDVEEYPHIYRYEGDR